MYKFYVDDCPENYPVGDWIKSQLPWREAKNDVLRPIINRKDINFVFDFLGDSEALAKSVYQSLEEHGYHGWLSSQGESIAYGGFSITYNPNLIYENQPIHQHTLGTKLNSQADFYAGSSKNHNGKLKNSYLDGCSFNQLTPAAKTGYMGVLLTEISKNITITRSRMGIVSGSVIPEQVGYHIDAEIFELIRLNIPVAGDDSYVFQVEGKDPYVLEVGKAYSWHTEWPHRVYCTKPSSIDRINMVIGLSPWLSYNYEDRYWYTNKFFGIKHPFDILMDGHVTDKIRFTTSF